MPTDKADLQNDLDIQKPHRDESAGLLLCNSLG